MSTTGTATGVESTARSGPHPATSPAPIGRFPVLRRLLFPFYGARELEDGTSKAMRDVEIGDRVKVAPGVYSPVFMFTHRVPGARGPFVQISTSDGASVGLTAGHFLHVNGELTPAKSVRVGDFLQNGNGVAVQVRTVEVIIKKGLFNPQTVMVISLLTVFKRVLILPLSILKLHIRFWHRSEPCLNGPARPREFLKEARMHRHL